MTPELEKIYNIAFDLIKTRLNKKEQVYPFTIHLIKGEEKPVILMRESLTSDQIKNFVESLREEMKSLSLKGDVTALCICYDMHITDPRTNEETDAALVELADRNGTKNIYVPYNFQDEEIIKRPFESQSEEVYL